MKAKPRKCKQVDPAHLQTLRYIDAKTAQALAPIAPRTFHQAIAEDRLGPAFRIGGSGRVVVRREDFLRYVESPPVEGAASATAPAETGGAR